MLGQAFRQCRVEKYRMGLRMSYGTKDAQGTPRNPRNPKEREVMSEPSNGKL